MHTFSFYKNLFSTANFCYRRLCGCTPWNYPHPPGEVEAVCDLMGGTCFEKVRKRQFIQKTQKIKLFPPSRPCTTPPASPPPPARASAPPWSPVCQTANTWSSPHTSTSSPPKQRGCVWTRNRHSGSDRKTFSSLCNFIVMMFLTERCAPRERVSPY